MAASQANLDYVQKMFVAYLGRASAASAQEYYAALIDTNETNGKAVLFDDLYNSAESQALYGSMTSDQVITQVFQNSFGKNPAFSGLTYYVDELAKGTFNLLEAAAIIADNADAAGAAILAAKQTAADKMTAELGADQTKIDAYTGNASEARQSLAKVTDTTTAAAYDAAAEHTAISSGNQVGSSFTLTTGQDIPAMSADNDTITGSVTALSSTTTYNDTDIIADATSTDNDILNVATTEDITLTPTITGVENINYTIASFTGGGDNVFAVNTSNIGPATLTLDVDQVGTTIVGATVTGLTSGSTINTSADFTGTVTLTGATDNEVITAAGAGSTYAVTSAGTLTNATLTSTNVVGTTFGTDADGVVTLTSSGDMVIDAVAAKTVVATSSKAITATAADLDAATSVTLTAGDEITATIDAATTATLSSGSTTAVSTIDSVSGSLTSLSLSGNAAATSFDVTGTNNLAAVTITGDQNVTVIASMADIDALTGGTGNIFTVTDTGTAGTSTLQLGTAVGDVDISNSVVDVVTMAFDNNAKIATVASGQAMVLAVDQTTVTIDGVDAGAASNTVSITLDDGVKTDGDDVDVTALVLTDFDSATINVSTDNNDGVKITPSLGTLTASADNTDVTIEAGANGITLGNNAHSVGTGGLTINSTAAVAMGTGTLTSGSFSATGSGAVTWNGVSGATNTTVTTGSGGDTLTLTATGDITINTGDGTDSVIIDADSGATDDIVYNLGGGTSDAISLNEGKDIDTFATLTISGAEILNLVETGADGYTGTMAASTLNGLSLVVLGGHATSDDVLTVTVAATDSTINLSGLNVNQAQFGVDAGDSITVDGSANTNSLTITGTNNKDTITGGAASDTIVGGAGNDVMVGGGSADTMSSVSGDNSFTGGDGGDTMTGGSGVDTFAMDGENDLAGDVITGGTGTDKITFASGTDTALDLTTATITLVEALTVADAADTVTLGQGTGIVTVTGLVDDTASTLTLMQASTAFEANAEASAAAVDVAGEWHFIEDAVVTTRAVLTYYDETLGAVKAITLAGVDAADNEDDDTAVMAGGNIVVSIA